MTDFLHAKTAQCQAPGVIQTPSLLVTCMSPPSLPFSKSFPCWVCGWMLGQELGETNSPHASGENSLLKPKLLKLSSNFYFLWGRNWPKQLVFFLSSQPLTSHELLTHHVTAVVGPWPEMWYLLSALITRACVGQGLSWVCWGTSSSPVERANPMCVGGRAVSSCSSRSHPLWRDAPLERLLHGHPAFRAQHRPY